MNAQSPVEILPVEFAPAPSGVAQTATAEQHDGSALLSVIARAASDPRVDIDKFERLAAMQERLEAAQARRDFDAALAAAKAEISPVTKNREVDFTSAKGRTHYRYEDFAAVARAVDGPLSHHGLSYRFRSAQLGEGDKRRVRVTCILSRGGHAEETTLECGEDHSGNKNAVQAIMSAATYLQRATLKLALGLAASEDDDGRAAGAHSTPSGPDAIGSDDVAYVRQLLRDTASDEAAFLRAAKADSVETLTPKKFKWAVDRLNQKRAMGAAK